MKTKILEKPTALEEALNARRRERTLAREAELDSWFGRVKQGSK